MTFAELEQSLPNGVHDGQLAQLSVDYVNRVATFEIDLWIGDLQSADYGIRETYRTAQVTIRGLRFLSVEPPQHDQPYADPGTVWVSSSGPIADGVGAKVGELVGGAFSEGLFMHDWNCFIYFSGESCELCWSSEPHTLR